MVGLRDLAASPALAGGDGASRSSKLGDESLCAAIKDAGRCVHDAAPRCRLACAKLLLCYAESRGLEACLARCAPKGAELLSRLAADDVRAPKVSAALAKLVVGSYVPQKAHAGDTDAAAKQVSRAVSLATKRPAAADALYSRLDALAPAGAAAKLVVMLAHSAAAAADQAEAEEEGRAPSTSKKGRAAAALWLKKHLHAYSRLGRRYDGGEGPTMSIVRRNPRLFRVASRTGVARAQGAE